jgi:hypothetical protein
MDNHNDIYERRKELAVYWYNKASDLRGAAGALWASMDDTRSNAIVEELGLGTNFKMKVATYPVYAMLCGMSLELLYKAIVVAKGNEPNTKTHALTILASNAGISVTNQQIGLLKILSEYIIWNGRYPVPKKPEQMQSYIELKNEHLFNKIPLGKFIARSPNGALNWESFNKLWNEAHEVYCHISPR